MGSAAKPSRFGAAGRRNVGTAPGVTRMAAGRIACRPEPHNRLTVHPGTVADSPAAGATRHAAPSTLTMRSSRAAFPLSSGPVRCTAAQAIRVESRKALFESLPVPVLGSVVMKTNSSGSHHLATIGVMCCKSSSAVAALPSRRTT